jgi:dolichol-phosphate mannosyltransferase
MIYVILPALNEERALSLLLPRLKIACEALHQPCLIIVVNDGSVDATPPLLETFSSTMPLHVITHSTNQGYGAALRSGFDFVLNHSASKDSIVISMDADGTHDPEYVPRLIERLTQGCDVVTASYRLPGGSATGIPWLRAFLSRTVNRLFRWWCPILGARTYSNGFRAYQVNALARVEQRFGKPLIAEDGFAGGTELFLKVAVCGGKALEIPFDLHYERRGPDSKIELFQTIFGYIRLMIRARCRF